MNKTARVLGATLGATAIIGSSAVAANAQGFGGHGDHNSFGGHHAGYSQSGPYSVRGAHQQFSKFNHHRGHGAGTFNVGQEFNHGWYRHHWAGHHHQHLTFAQKQAKIVARLQNADTRLSDLITKVSAAAAQNPDGWAAKALPFLQQQQTKLESLISAVQAATTPQELAQAFKDAFQPPAGTTQPTPPTGTPTPTPSAAPSA